MRVPIYDAPQVATAALPEVRSRLDMRTGLDAVGRGVQQLGAGAQHVVDVQEHEQRVAHEKAIAAASTDAETRLSSRLIDIEHGPADRSRKGFYEMQGQEALAQSAPTIEAMAKAREEIASKLAPGVKELFVARTNNLLLQHRRNAEVYTAAQSEALNKATADARGEAAEKVWGLQYGNADLLATEREAARTAIATQLHGMPGEVIHARLADLDQRLSAAALGAAIQAKDLPAAERLLSTYGDALGTKRAQLERTVATLKAQTLGEKNAAAAITVAVDPETGLVDEAALDEAFDATPEEARTPEFLAAFEKQKTAALALDKGHRAGVYRQALTQYIKGGGLAAVDAQTRTWLIDNDPEGWDRLQSKADHDAAAKVRTSRGGSGPTHDEIAAANRLAVDMKDHPEKYAAMTSEEFDREWSPVLSDSDWAKGGAALAAIHGQANKPDKDLRLPVLAVQALTGIFRDTYHLDAKATSTAKWKPEQQALFYDALNQVELQERQWKREHGGNAPPLEQYVKWGEAELRKHPVPGTGIHIPIIDTTIGEKETNRVEQRQKGLVVPGEATPKPVSAAGLNLNASPVPSDARARIVTALTRAGRTPTEKDISDLYVAGVAKGIFQ